MVEYWPIKKFHVVKMRMLGWMYGHSKSENIRNEVIQKNMEVTSVVDKMRKAGCNCLGICRGDASMLDVGVQEASCWGYTKG